MKKIILLSVFFLCLVTVIRGQYWIYNDLSEPKYDMGSVSLGTKVYFAGGDNESNTSAEIEVYDISAEDWDTVMSLSVARCWPACVATGSKVFFAGGLDWYTFGFFSEVDIWDADLKVWDYQQLSVPRFSIGSAAKGNKVLFAGGTNLALNETYDVVDIYDISTGLWTVEYLSEPRSAMACAVNGDLAFFAGGHQAETSTVTDIVDIYRFSTGTWTTATLSVARTFLTATAVGSKVLFAGGNTADDNSTDIVDIYDTLTGTWETAHLSFARSLAYDYSATVSGKAYFVGGGDFNFGGYWENCSDVIDIYDPNAPDPYKWTVDHITHQAVNHTVAGLGDHLFVAAGACNYTYSTVEILIDPVGINERKAQDDFLLVYPNPSSGRIHLDPSGALPQKEMAILLYNLQGQKVYEKTLPAGSQEISVLLPNGVYLLKVQTGERVQQELVTVQR